MLDRLFKLQFAILSLLVAFQTSVKAQGNSRLVDREEAALRAAAERVADSVVQIRTIGGLDLVGSELRTDGPTTGLVVSADGFIISSTFSFTTEPASILVTFASGKQVPAELVATDHSRKLVLLKVHEEKDLPVPVAAPMDEIRVGQWAVAVGRTIRSDEVNVTAGIVSAVGRMYGKVLQTDADVSTANYGGPLVDIRGRVLGVIVPIAPQGAGEVAGAEWYDSGIGFAVPLSSIADPLERMKRSEDQYGGLLGIGMSAKNPHSAPAELTTVRPDSPAGQAGLKKGDRILSVDERPIKTQTDLRFALGPLYGGESVRIVALRGDERIVRTIELAGKLKAFRHAFLGILPIRPFGVSADEDSKQNAAKDVDPAEDRPDEQISPEDSDQGLAEENDATKSENEQAGKQSRGIVVRMVYPGSPAEKAGIQAGDQIIRINDADVVNIGDVITELNNVVPGSSVKVQALRGDDQRDFRLSASILPTNVPEQLPPASILNSLQPVKAADAQPAAVPEGKIRELRLPEFKQTCQIYVPATPKAAGPAGMLLWLHAPGMAETKETIAMWRPICDRDNLLLVVPTSEDSNRWERTEVEFLRRLTEQVMRKYGPDAHRVVVYGHAGGGAMAWILALSSRDIFHGVATTAAPLPRQIKLPENEPSLRLAVLAGVSGDEGAAAQITNGLIKLAEAGYPVTTTDSDRSGQLSDTGREELARWIDTLDRF